MKLPFLPLIRRGHVRASALLARHATRGPLRALLWPGFLVQRITTIEPDDAQLEVALAALAVTAGRERNRGAPEVADRSFADFGAVVAR